MLTFLFPFRVLQVSTLSSSKYSPGQKSLGAHVLTIAIGGSSYAPTIFRSIGLNSSTSGILATGIVGVVNFVFTIPACLFVDNWGRKPTLFIGSVTLATCLAIIAAIVAQFGDDWANNETAGNAAVRLMRCLKIWWFC